MTDERRSTWARRLAEGLTIVVSILLALLADAAWEYRGHRAEERRLLAALVLEFAEASDEVESDLEARAQMVQQIERLLLARIDPGQRPPPDAVPDLVFEILNWRFYTPGHAVLDDALTSGRLELIRSDEVRRALMAYEQARSRMPVMEGLERAFVTEQVEPYLSTRVALDRLEEEVDERVRRAEGERFLALLSDDTFASLLQLRVDRTLQAIIFSQGVRRAIVRVQEALGG